MAPNAPNRSHRSVEKSNVLRPPTFSEIFDPNTRMHGPPSRCAAEAPPPAGPCGAEKAPAMDATMAPLVFIQMGGTIDKVDR